MERRRQGLSRRDRSRHRVLGGSPRSSSAGWAIVEGLEPRELLTLGVTPITVPEGTIFHGTVGTFQTGDVSGSLIDYSAAINWGDGTSSAATITPTTPGNFSISGTHTYTRENIFPLLVNLNGANASTASALGTATVTDVAPVVTVAAITPTAHVPFSGTIASFTDAGPDQASQYSVAINWGDGTPITSGIVTAQTGSTTAFDISATHTYATSVSRIATVSVTTLGGTTGTGTRAVIVTDPAPVVAAPAITPVAGVPFSGNVASFTDANPNLVPGSFAATITWGDGSPPSAGTIVSNSTGGFNVSGNHTYNQVNNFPTTITVIRLPDNQQTTATGLAVVNNPVVTVTALNITPSAGLPFTGFVASFTDTNTLAVRSDFTATIDWGDGHATAGMISNRINGGFNVTGTNTYASSNQSFPVQVTVTRTSNAAIARATGMATVSDAVLSIASLAPTTATVGQLFALQAVLNDTNTSAQPGDYLITINWGDGTASPPSSVTFGATAASGVNFNVLGTHTYTQAGNDQIVVTAARLVNGQFTIGTEAVSVVANVTLTPFPTTITPQAGVPFTNLLVGSFTSSPPSLSGFVATINWGDGQSSVGTVVSRGAGAFDVLGSHIYGATTPSGTTVPVTISVTEPGVPAGTATIASHAVVVARPFVGGLDPLFDTGFSNADGITRINQPKFSGSAQPYSQIQIYIQSAQQLSPIFLGGTIAGADGSWSVFAPGPLADGAYAVSAVVTPPSGSPLISVALPSITIDTVSPVLLGVLNNPSTGQITVVYRDNASGISPAALSNPGLYTLIFGPLTRRQAASVSAHPATSVSLPTDPQGAVVTLGLTLQQRRNLRGLRVVSNGVTDLAGNALAGGNATILIHPGKGHAVRTPKVIHQAVASKVSHKK